MRFSELIYDIEKLRESFKDSVKKKPISAYRASYEIGVTHITLGKFLNGKNARLDTLYKIDKWILERENNDK